MKKNALFLKIFIAFICISGIFGAFLLKNSSDPEDGVHALCSILPEYAKYTGLARNLSAVTSHCLNYQNILNRARLVAKQNPDFRLDIILQFHYSLQDPDNQFALSLVKKSQGKIKDFLRETQFELVAVEGLSLDSYTRMTHAQASADYAKAVGTNMPLEEVLQIQEQIVPNDGVLAYILECGENCFTKFIGAEESDLLGLHSAVVSFQVFNHKDLANLQRLSIKLVNLRSEVAIARAVLSLAKAGKKKGGVIMGYNHEKSLSDYMHALDIKGSVIDLAGKRI